jgi:hypothetical protein
VPANLSLHAFAIKYYLIADVMEITLTFLVNDLYLDTIGRFHFSSNL